MEDTEQVIDAPEPSNDEGVSQEPAAPAIEETADASGLVDHDGFDPSLPGPNLGAHKQILENTRTKTREEVEGQYRQSWGGRDFGEVQRIIAEHDARAANPEAWGRAAAHQFQPQPQQPEYPQPLRDQNTGGYYYDASQLEQIRQIDRDQLVAEFRQELAPLQQQQQQSERQHKQQAKAEQELQELERSLPEFSNLIDKIQTELAGDQRLSVMGAWRRVYDRDFLPTIKQGERQKVKATVGKKLQAASEQRASRSSGTSGARKYSRNAKKGFEQALADVEADA